MQFTLDQYMSLIALAAAMTMFGFFSYHCGLRDRKQKLKALQQKYYKLQCSNVAQLADIGILEHRAHTNAQAVELLNDELEAANIIKQRQLSATRMAEDIADAYIEHTRHTTAELETLRGKVMSDSQRITIKQAAAQLLMTAQVMEAMQNQSSAKTQRTLAKRLQSIISEPIEPTPESEAA